MDMAAAPELSLNIRPYADESSRWAALAARDPRADGHFYYAVRTTGVYCRPSCAARLARRENVAFYDSCESAEEAGFRPCKRCRPRERSVRESQVELIARACRAIEASEEPPDLSSLANAAGLSRFHFHRLFKRLTGMTPKAYAMALRAGRVQQTLHAGASVTEAIYAAGYNSNSRFYARSAATLGMLPSEFRAGGVGVSIRFAVAQCTLGAVLVAATDRGLCAIQLGEDADALVRELQDRFPRADLIGGDAEFEQWVAQVLSFIEAPQLGLDLPLDIRGTAFQRRVWQALREIPPGTTVTYAQIARRIGAPTATRAVAQACAANPLAVAIPCHRVVRTDGALSGYRWGVERKRELLARERRE